MAKCQGKRKALGIASKCGNVLLKCNKCGNIGCNVIWGVSCSNEEFKDYHCMKCGSKEYEETR
jgi:hypothetical protein